MYMRHAAQLDRRDTSIITAKPPTSAPRDGIEQRLIQFPACCCGITT